jgi:hypothetical protein
MAKYFNSPLLGRVRVPSADEEKQIDKLLNECTLFAFQSLNKKFNTMGLCLSISLNGKET